MTSRCAFGCGEIVDLEVRDVSCWFSNFNSCSSCLSCPSALRNRITDRSVCTECAICSIHYGLASYVSDSGEREFLTCLFPKLPVPFAVKLSVSLIRVRGRGE